MEKITKIELLATPTHSHPIFQFLPFSPPVFSHQRGQKIFVAHKFFCLTRFSLISLAGHVANQARVKKKSENSVGKLSLSVAHCDYSSSKKSSLKTN